MNKLYGILLGPCSISDDYKWYAKNYTTVPISDKGVTIREELLKDLDLTKIALFASLACYLSLLSPYGQEIKELDANNTYVAVTRPPNTESSSSDYNAWDLIKPADSYENTISCLDDDIKTRLDTESFISIIGALCLQLLRESII